MDLLQNLRESGVISSILFITHDFGLVADICDYVAVMYAGLVVEFAPTVELFDNPAHPYTQGLFGALPQRRENRRNVRDRCRHGAVDAAPAAGMPFSPSVPQGDRGDVPGRTYHPCARSLRTTGSPVTCSIRPRFRETRHIDRETEFQSKFPWLRFATCKSTTEQGRKPSTP